MCQGRSRTADEGVVEVTNTVCLLDIDGVLANFWTAAVHRLGLKVADSFARVPPGEWSFVAHLGYSDNEFWKIIDSTPGFWEGLAKMPDADLILETCEVFFPGRVFLLTAPPLNPEAYSGKARWVRERYPKLYRKLFIGPAKEAFAHAGAVLVDDNDGNCEKFRAAGGNAVLVPRRWNSGHGVADDALHCVRQELLHLGHERREE